jgi:hypothetical protein
MRQPELRLNFLATRFTFAKSFAKISEIRQLQ